jgi:hypothetical protein
LTRSYWTVFVSWNCRNRHCQFVRGRRGKREEEAPRQEDAPRRSAHSGSSLLLEDVLSAVRGPGGGGRRSRERWLWRVRLRKLCKRTDLVSTQSSRTVDSSTGRNRQTREDNALIHPRNRLNPLLLPLPDPSSRHPLCSIPLRALHRRLTARNDLEPARRFHLAFQVWRDKVGEEEAFDDGKAIGG